MWFGFRGVAGSEMAHDKIVPLPPIYKCETRATRVRSSQQQSYAIRRANHSLCSQRQPRQLICLNQPPG